MKESLRTVLLLALLAAALGFIAWTRQQSETNLQSQAPQPILSIT